MTDERNNLVRAAIQIASDYRDGALDHGEMIKAMSALAALPGCGVDWVSVNDRLPEYGQRIEGRNAAGQTWEEEYDPYEPLGLMREWRPRTASPREKKHGTPTPSPHEADRNG